MSDLNQLSLEDDDYSNIFITQEAHEDSVLDGNEVFEEMDSSGNAKSQHVVGDANMYSDISDDETFDQNDSGVK